jgi:hypothetical protein
MPASLLTGDVAASADGPTTAAPLWPRLAVAASDTNGLPPDPAHLRTAARYGTPAIYMNKKATLTLSRPRL